MSMQAKSASVEVKTNSTPGEFTAVISAIGNVDRENDRVMPQAFSKAMELDPVPPCYWAHKHDIPPIGEGLEWKEDGKNIVYTGRLFVKGDIEHQYANMVYAGMKSYDGRQPAIRQFSYTYGVPEGGAEFVKEGGKMIRNLHEIRPVAEIGPCFMGMNPQTGLIDAAKAVDLAELKAAKMLDAALEVDFFQFGAKAEWDQAYMDSLPDSSFLYVQPGGKKDDTGRTVPRDLRHFPYKNSQGQIDMPHLRDAIGRAPQADTLAEDVRNRVQTRAQRILRSQEGKALLLSTIFSSKAWDDIEGYEVMQLLEILDGCVTYIQMEDDPGDVAQMQAVVHTLLDLLRSEFDEAAAGGDDESNNADAMSIAKAAVEMAIELYSKAAQVSGDVSSEGTPSILNKEIASLLLVGPSH